MLDQMDAIHLVEWMAFDKIEEENYKRSELAARAESGMRNHRRGGR